MSTQKVVALVLLAVAVAAGLYFLLDDTPVAWLVRLSYAGALTAGAAVVVLALERLSRNP
jgi:hypothetical protein